MTAVPLLSEVCCWLSFATAACLLSLVTYLFPPGLSVASRARALLLLLLLLWLFALAQEGIYNAGVQMTTGFRSCETGDFYDVISPSETEIDFILLFLSGFLFPTWNGAHGAILL